ncbi:hypothetical protein BX600DRAFT_65552 [Xylariales sp. PMI_506]|nr:hypothetical protein BX600DRAFT_65552 [Xylariales sp. PMI_506]
MISNRLEVGFIQTEAGAVDSAYNAPSTYDEQRAVFRPKLPVHILEDALTRYQDLGCTPKLDFDTSNCSWDQVGDVLAEARKEYDGKSQGHGITNTVRKVFRKAGDHADTFQPMLQMIPDEYGLGVLRAALGWVFTLAKGTATTRKAIFSTFEEIPAMVIRIEATKKNFSQDKRLSDLMAKFYETLFEAMAKSVRYLLPKYQVAKIFPSFSKVPSPTEISEMIQNVNTATSNVREHAEILAQGTSVQTLQLAQENRVTLQAVRFNTMQSIAGTRDVAKEIAQVGHTVEHLVEDMREDLTQREKAAIEALTGIRSELEGIKSQNSLLSLLNDFRYQMEARIAAFESQAQIQARRTEGLMQLLEGTQTALWMHALPAPSITPVTSSDLLMMLRVTPQQIAGDLERTIRQYTQLDRVSTDRAESLLKTDRFWAWYMSNSSDLLMLDGDFATDAAMIRINPLSAVSATIIASILNDQPGSISLYHFCTQHTASIDDLSGPQGLLRCLITKLLIELPSKCGVNVNLSFINSLSYVEGLGSRRIDTLCSAFHQILMQAPLGTRIFCIIDAISWYERSETVQDALFVMEMLQFLISPQGSPIVFKVLLTSPFPSQRLASKVERHQRIIPRSHFFGNNMLLGPGNFTGNATLAPHLRRYGQDRSRSHSRERNSNDDEEWTADDYT